MTLIDASMLIGIAVVLPLAAPTVARSAWTACAAAAAAAVLMSEGLAAAALASVWPAVAGVASIAAARHWFVTRAWTISALVGVAVPAFAAVAGMALVPSCLGANLFGLDEPIVQLTAVHFTFAAAGGTALAGAVHRHSPGRWSTVASAGALLTVAAPPVVAIGFVTGVAVPQVGGAVVMTLGVWATAAAQLAGLRARPTWSRSLLVASSLAVLGAMPLAVAWAAAQHWAGVPALSIPDMVRTHGMLNGVLFVPCGLVAWKLVESDGRPRAAVPA